MAHNEQNSPTPPQAFVRPGRSSSPSHGKRPPTFHKAPTTCHPVALFQSTAGNLRSGRLRRNHPRDNRILSGPADLAVVWWMDESLANTANSPGTPGFELRSYREKSTRSPRQNPRIPHGFHTKCRFRTAHPASPRSNHQRTDARESAARSTFGRFPCRSAI